MIDPAEIELLKRQIEAQVGDYQRALTAYAEFLEDWRARNDPASKRIRRFRQAARAAE